ncbi:MAG: SAM-dependent DNA methyltransferase [Planctomycetes bacterium]|nr:SAM-dependent DNA methyltransferase [Planctomycetota bacterium]
MAVTVDPAVEGPRPVNAKGMGAFYTDTRVAEFLVRWAVRDPTQSVLDPSFGGGVFLRCATERLRGLGGDPARLVFGVEVDAEVHGRVAAELADVLPPHTGNLLRADFFDVSPDTLGEVDAVVGNPPFIRYHRFTGSDRDKALRRAASEGVALSRLTSSWAPFVVHCAALVKPGGRLALVLPMELGHAAYARPVVEFLSRRFRRLTFLTFRTRLFPDLSEDTLLLLAEGKGEPPSGIFWRDLPDAAALERFHATGRLPGLRRLDAESFTNGGHGLVECFVPARALSLYRGLRRHRLVRRLGDMADVGIGYVTGANAFFHLSHDEATRWHIPDAFLRPAVLRGRSLRGLRFTQEDWHKTVRAGEAAFLLHIRPTDHPLPDSVRRYLEHGAELGVPTAFKCRTRSPWYCVPHVYRPDALLTYMIGAAPSLVANDAGVVVPNSLHMLRLRPGAAPSPAAVAAMWQTSLTRLSVEIEGHALGGGMLKLEPTEAGNVLLAASGPGDGHLDGLARELDCMLRRGEQTAARDLADRTLLIGGLGLDEKDCRVLRRAADLLRQRRYPCGDRE